MGPSAGWLEGLLAHQFLWSLLIELRTGVSRHTGSALISVYRLPARQIGAAGNQPCSALIRQIRPRPLDQHDDAIAESDQKEDVHEQPCHPGDESRDVNLAELRDPCRAPDGRQAAFVEIIKVLSGLALEFASYVCGGRPPLLHRDWSDTRQPVSILVFQCRQIADHEHFGTSG